MDQLLPDWAQEFGDPDAANDYWDLVCELAHTRWGDGITANYLAGTVRLPEGGVAYLHNIARSAATQDRLDQRRFLYGFLAGLDDLKRDSERVKDWSWAGPRLRRRLQCRWEPDFDVLLEPIDSRTQWMVGLDTGTGCVPVNTEWLDDWQMTADQVWQRATTQSIRPPGLQRSRIDRVESDPSTSLRFHNKLFRFEGDMFATGIAMDLSGRFQKSLGDLGALVVAPAAHALYALPIRCLDDVSRYVVPLMVLTVLDQHIDPNAVSNSVLWYRGPGQLEPCMEFRPPYRAHVTCRSEPVQGILEALEEAA